MFYFILIIIMHRTIKTEQIEPIRELNDRIFTEVSQK